VSTIEAWMTALQDWVVAAGGTWWVPFVVFGLCAVDAFFPTVPSESVIVALSSLWASSSVPPIWLTVIAGWTGAFLGDNIAYLIGRTVGWKRFGFLHRGRGLAAVQAAERGLERRALLFLMTARYIPLGRTAVNLTAGAVRYPWRKFWHRSLAATFVWAVYSCTIGAVAGSWFEDNHLLAITVAVVIAVVVALIVERLVSMINERLDRRHERATEAAAREAEEAEQTRPQSGADTPVGSSEDGSSAAPRTSDDPPPSREGADQPRTARPRSDEPGPGGAAPEGSGPDAPGPRSEREDPAPCSSPDESADDDARVDGGDGTRAVPGSVVRALPGDGDSDSRRTASPA
jgi:membrane-associated protein